MKPLIVAVVGMTLVVAGGIFEQHPILALWMIAISTSTAAFIFANLERANSRLQDVTGIENSIVGVNFADLPGWGTHAHIPLFIYAGEGRCYPASSLYTARLDGIQVVIVEGEKP